MSLSRPFFPTRPLLRQLAFLPQDDSLVASLTVLESVSYVALLRLPTRLSPADIQVPRVLERFRSSYQLHCRHASCIADPFCPRAKSLEIVLAPEEP